ncbi:hypothetical protein [Streptomyces flavidovirens]
MSRPDRLDEDQRIFFEPLRERCPELTIHHHRIRSFADVLAKKRGDLLDRRITQVKADGIQLLHSASFSSLTPAEAPNDPRTTPPDDHRL